MSTRSFEIAYLENLTELGRYRHIVTGVKRDTPPKPLRGGLLADVCRLHDLAPFRHH